MKSLFKRLVSDKTATTSIEYGVLCLAIAVAILASIQNFGTGLAALWDRVHTETDKVM